MGLKTETFDCDYWYVVNEKYRHIVYRNKDKAKAVKYATTKNKFLHNDPTTDLCYRVISGAQANSGQVHAIGRLARKEYTQALRV